MCSPLPKSPYSSLCSECICTCQALGRVPFCLQPFFECLFLVTRVGIASSYTAPAGLIFGDDVESLFLDLGIPPTGVC